MGQMRFLVPRPDRIQDSSLQRAYLAGGDHIPWQTDVRWDGRVLIADREVRESGHFYMPWQIDGHGEYMLSTASLMERKGPYLLPVELARGTLHRLRTQLHGWQLAQFTPSPPVQEKLSAAQLALIGAATSQGDPVIAGDLAEEALRLTFDALELVTRDFTRNVLALRHQQTPQLSTLLGAPIDQPPSGKVAKWFQAAFNTAVIPLAWSQIQPTEHAWEWELTEAQWQWSREQGMKIIAGPLLHPNRRCLPAWLDPVSRDFDLLLQRVCTFVEATVQRLQGRVHVWHVAAGMNVEPAVRMSEEERLRLTVAAIERVRRLDPRTPVIVSFDQPWGESMARRHLELSPLHFADMLVRSDLGVAGLGLEMNFGYVPGGSSPRDFCDIGRQLDQWAALGLPLVAFLTLPSSATPDPLASEASRTLERFGPHGPSFDQQRKSTERLVEFLLAKQAVHGIVWNQLRDDLPHDWPHGGLFEDDQNRKSAIEVLADLRKQHLT